MSGPYAMHRTRVEWIDTDAAGIYHNTTVVRFAEAAEAELMRAYDIPGYFPVAPRVRYEVEFEASIRFGEEVETRVELIRLGRSSMTFGFEVWRGASGDGPRRRAARGSYVTVHVPDKEAGGSAPWPAAWRAALSRTGTAADLPGPDARTTH
ncbi:thioesterase family protein [Streptomyces sp. MBT53]|uniref:acyl-CoA thioesterase n=1 Tax=Streptomyces sp. MBT53 TaxID=1488384 RepID=UPI001914245D|nr:acyl-CoA thioesterase [Streptomyces sp. MBT53]MBK6017878.1 acyl-CoA thioesterase [Streptomyces sp. MBT53]